jgi:type VI secretion system secreted protein Hcp
MKIRTSVLLLGVLGGLAVAGSASAADDIFLSLTGIKGESVAAGHTGEIDILSFSQTVARAPNGGAPTCGVITVQKLLDKASAPLAGSVFTGNYIQQGVLTIAVPSGAVLAPLYKVTLQNVLVTSVSQGASAGGGTPVETVSLQAQRVQLDVYTLSASGGTSSQTIATINCMTDTAQ